MRRCEEVRHELGGHAVGGLGVEEHARVEGHLRACPACREEAAELAGVSQLLDLVTDAPPPHLRERVLAATARRRKARRRVMGLVAAALLLGALIGGAATVTVWPQGSDERVTVRLAPGEGFDAAGIAELRETDDGLRVRLALEDITPLPEPSVYEAWLARPEGEEPESIGRFAGSSEGQVDLSLLADGSADDYAYIWITAEPDAAWPGHEGPTVLAAPLHPDDDNDE